MTVHGVELSKPDKVLFPDAGITKLDLATYYDAVAGVMVPHLRGRPVNMQRFPDGIEGMAFYEKKVPSHFPDWVRTTQVDTADGPQRQVVADSARTLVYLAQQACITPHTWLSRDDDLGRPDQLIFDLDPTDSGPGTLAKVRRATRLVGAALEDLGLTTYLKTTGSRGYHVLVPIRRDLGYDEVRGFARAVAARLVAAEPDLLTLEHRKAKRGDRVFVDVLRNGYGQTAVPPYAVRPRPGAPVATPIEWSELSRVAPDGHDIHSVRRRLARRTCPWADLHRHARGLKRALARVG
jgi:bifunctional non-homologous end joining protein LigD